MKDFIFGQTYSRKAVWNIFHPDKEFPTGGPWNTDYLTEREFLIAFLNIGVPGRTGHDFPNLYDEEKEIIEWFGKPNAHSQQSTFRRLFQGELKLLIFLRWNNTNRLFTFMGSPFILKFQDNVAIGTGLSTIKIYLRISDENQEGFGVDGDNVIQLSEGAKVQSTVSRFERNPRLRAECIEYHGFVCKACGFDFEKIYGALGRNFCHVHHILPLSEFGEPRTVDPKIDLIPLCANCHAMIHRKQPALTPDQLRAIISKLVFK